MKIKYFSFICCILSTFAQIGCSDDTGTMGIYENQDAINTEMATFPIATCSQATGDVLANNTNPFLGRVIDPETGGMIEADFAAQFNCVENFSFPPINRMVYMNIDAATGDSTIIGRGIAHCDSIEVRLFLKSYYGDDNNPMKVEVYNLDKEKIMEEEYTYQTNVDLSQFVQDASPIASKAFTPVNYIVPENQREDTEKYLENVRIMLPTSFGQEIMDTYYTHPEYFKDSYHFIRNVFPGFYFRISNGEGTMLSASVLTINLYYKYADKTNTNKIYDGMARFSATPEVIQSTRIKNEGVDKLIEDENCTYLKTPAGICTEMTLPINDIYKGHANDSISKAAVTLTRYNKEVQDDYQLGTPSSLLLVRKQYAQQFFKDKSVTNSTTNYVTSYSSAYNTYTFSNISKLITYCMMERKYGAKELGISEEEWEARNPDWNKVLLVPVTITTNSSKIVTSVNHDMNLNSIKLKKGTIVNNKSDINIEITYSKFNQ